MNVLQVVPGISPRFGGPSVALTDLTRLMSERGVNATLLTTNADPVGRLDVPLGVPSHVRGASVTYYGVWPRGRYGFSMSLASAILRTARNYDLLHIHWLYNFSSVVAALAARRARVPFVVQPNGSLDPVLMRKNRLVKGAYLTLAGSSILRHASGLIFTTEAERRLAGSDAAKAPTYVVPVGLDWEAYAELPPCGLFRQEHPETEGKRLVLFLSRISRQKGLDLLIPAFRAVASTDPDAHLVIAGPDSEGYEAEVRRWVNTAGLGQRVTFAGRIPDALKLAAYVDCDVFVLPSHAENFGAVVTEALACARPVVISDRVNICDEVDSAGAGVVVRSSPDAVAAGICRVLRDPATARQMGQNGREFVQRRFTWDVALDSLIQIYREVINGDGGP